MPPPSTTIRPTSRAAGVLVAVVVVALLLGGCGGGRDDVAAEAVSGSDDVIGPDKVVLGEVRPVDEQGVPIEDPDNGPGVVVEGSRLSPSPEPAPAVGLVQPDGAPTGPAIPFSTQRAGVDRTVFVLVAGSDARPGESITRTRADSIHIVAVNPDLRRGTIVGLPRDSWVDVPGKGKRKINAALALGGPQLLASTVTRATGIELDYYLLTGFDGIVDLTNALGGVDVEVERRMNDRNSGARFERGWHLFEGVEVLAFSRNRKDVALGDFSRSENQGRIMLATLGKFRAEIGDDGGIGRWLRALRDHVVLDIGMDDLFSLAVTARRLDPAYVDNVVASGTTGTAQGQSVVFLDDEARAMFRDVAADGVIGSPPPAPATTTTTSTPPSSTPTSAPGTTTPTTSPQPPSSFPTTTAAPPPSSSTTLLPLG